MKPSPDRHRASSPRQFDVDVVTLDGAVASGRTPALRPSGLDLPTDKLFELGTPCAALLHLEERDRGEPLRLPCRVSRVDEAGISLVFGALDEESSRRLHALLAG